jgi:hypothetical protein
MSIALVREVLYIHPMTCLQQAGMESSDENIPDVGLIQ